MSARQRLKSSQLFTLAGVVLVVLAFVTFPTKVMLQAQPGDEDDYMVGWLFSPIIGVWGLVAVTLGIVQSSMPRRKAESYLLFILSVVCVALTYGAYLAVVFGSGLTMSVGKGEPFFLLFFVLVIVPSLVTIVSTVKFLKTEDRQIFLVSKRAKAATLLSLVAVPWVYTGILLAYLNVF